MLYVFKNWEEEARVSVVSQLLWAVKEVNQQQPHSSDTVYSPHLRSKGHLRFGNSKRASVGHQAYGLIQGSFLSNGYSRQ